MLPDELLHLTTRPNESIVVNGDNSSCAAIEGGDVNFLGCIHQNTN